MPELQPIDPKFNEVPWLNVDLLVKGIYTRWKVISISVSGSGDVKVLPGFPPKYILASCQDSTEWCDGASDFSSSYSRRIYTNTWALAFSRSSNLVNLSSIQGNVTKRLTNWFIFNVSSFTGGAKTIDFTCFS